MKTNPNLFNDLNPSNPSNTSNYIKYTAKIAILGALAAIIMLFEFPLLFIAPGFYKLDLSETVVLMGGFALGPVATILIELVKILINLIITGTQTGGVGEFANFAIGIAFTLPAALIYKYKKSFKGALIGIVLGVVTLGVMGAAINYFVMLPFYSKFMPLDAIISAGQAIIPVVKNKFTFVLCCVLPFNLIKGVICSAICLVLYKRLSKILHI